MLSNVTGSPRTTLAGALGVVFSIIGSQIVPALAAYFGAQPGIMWQVLGMALGAIPGAFMTDLAKKLAAAIDPPKPPVAPAVMALLVGGSLLFAVPARAQEEAQPGGLLPQAGACFKDGSICFQPAVTVVPIVIDFRSGDVSHDVAFSFGYGIVFPKALTPTLVPGADVLGGTQTGGGWNAAFLLRLGVVRVGPVVTHKPGVTYAGFGVGTGI